MADAPDLGSGVFGHRGSSPLSRTIKEVFPLKIILKKTPFFIGKTVTKPSQMDFGSAKTPQNQRIHKSTNNVETTNSRPFARQSLKRIPFGAWPPFPSKIVFSKQQGGIFAVFNRFFPNFFAFFVILSLTLWSGEARKEATFDR